MDADFSYLVGDEAKDLLVGCRPEESATVYLARTAAPAFAAGLYWPAWGRALRSGAEASR